MTSTSLFDNMEFSLQPEDYLDQTFGLSAEILAADLNTDGGILDLGHGFSGGLKSENDVPALQGPEDTIDDLLFQDTNGGSFGEEWMETVDLSVFLDPDNKLSTPAVLPPVPPPQPEPVPQKSEVKNNAFELLKSLLTGAISEKSLLAGPISITEVQPSSSGVPASPEAEVPNVNFFTDDLLAGVEAFHKQSQNPVSDFTVKSEIIDSTSVIDISQVDVASPISSDDIESLLSSEPSSPEGSITLHTVDTSQLDDSFSSQADSSFDQDSKSNVVVIRESKRKAKKQKPKSSPYDSDDGLYTNKKDRKKVQNKNAATRYRVKKRMEKETLQQQENVMSEKNRELREKVDSLQREIAYMKELMNEIYKAKGVKREIV